MNIHVGNIAYTTTKEDLESLFSEHGNVASVAVITDKITGKSRGFAFVTMESNEEGAKAVEALDGQEFQGRRVRVSEAQSREERPRKPFNGGGRF